MNNKQSERFKSVASKRKVKTQSGETPSQIRPSPSRNMCGFQYSFILQESMNRGQKCVYGFMGKICLGIKFLRLKNSTTCAKKTENNRFRVPIHFAINRFTFEKFPQPPPLLHPDIHEFTYMYTYINVYIYIYIRMYV